VLLLALPWAANSAENLVRNGGFESGKLGGWGTHPKENVRIAPNGQGGSKHCLAFEANDCRDDVHELFRLAESAL